MDLGSGTVGLIGGLLVAVIPSGLLYRSTRQRDAPTIEVARQNADVAGARAVAELWSEYAAQVRRDMDQVYSRLEVAERGLAECLDAQRRLTRARDK